MRSATVHDNTAENNDDNNGDDNYYSNDDGTCACMFVHVRIRVHSDENNDYDGGGDDNYNDFEKDRD